MFPPKLFTHAYRSSGLGERVTGQLSDISGARFWAEEIGGQNWKVWCIKMRATPSSFSLPGGSLCVCTGLHSITPAVKKWSRVARLIAGSDLKFARDARFVIVRSSLRERGRGLIQTLPRFVRDSIRFPLLDWVAATRFSFGYYTNICSFLPRRKYKSRFVCMHTCTSKKRISAASIFREEGFAGSLRPYFPFFLSFEESNPVPIPR